MVPLVKTAREPRTLTWLDIAKWMCLAWATVATVAFGVALITMVTHLLQGGPIWASVPVAVPYPPRQGELHYGPGSHVQQGSEVRFTEATVLVANAPTAYTLFTGIGQIILCLSNILVALGLWRIASETLTGRPFATRTVRALSIVSLSLLIGPLLGYSLLTAGTTTLGGLQYFAAGGPLTIDPAPWQLPWAPILVAVGLGLLVLIFRRAISLQEEVDTLV